MTPHISVLVPTRRRTGLLETMLCSLMATVSDQAAVDIVIRIDDDDHESATYLGVAPFPCQMLVGPHYNGYPTLAKFINECADRAKADLLIVVNDDVTFETKGWDTKLVAMAAKYPDGIFDFGVDTVLNNANYVFPCQSRRQVETLGCFFDDRLIYPDIWLRDVLKPFGRAIRVPEVVIRHNWQGQSHEQRRAVPMTQTATYQALYHQCVREGQEKIRKALAEVAA